MKLSKNCFSVTQQRYRYRNKRYRAIISDEAAARATAEQMKLMQEPLMQQRHRLQMKWLQEQPL
jgi:hypothetical protein